MTSRLSPIENRILRLRSIGALLLADRATKPKSRAAWVKLARMLEGMINE